MLPLNCKLVMEPFFVPRQFDSWKVKKQDEERKSTGMGTEMGIFLSQLYQFKLQCIMMYAR